MNHMALGCPSSGLNLIVSIMERETSVRVKTHCPFVLGALFIGILGHDLSCCFNCQPANFPLSVMGHLLIFRKLRGSEHGVENFVKP